MILPILNIIRIIIIMLKSATIYGLVLTASLIMLSIVATLNDNTTLLSNAMGSKKI